MSDPPLEWRRGELIISTDRSRIDQSAALALLRTTFWAAEMDLAVLARAIANSMCFGVYDREVLVGFGRAVTDLSTYGYWTDVVIAESYRGRGLGRWLSECMLAHPDLQHLRRVTLLTRDAETMYAGVSFTVGPGRLIYMEHH